MRDNDVYLVTVSGDVSSARDRQRLRQLDGVRGVADQHLVVAWVDHVLLRRRVPMFEALYRNVD